MVTYTASHKRTTPLAEILKTVKDGVRAFKSGERFQTIREATGWQGSVKSLEITYGKNGWHPHVHELVFAQVPPTEQELDVLEVALKQHWVNVLGRNGWVASTEHGLKVSDDKYDLARYVAKFGHEPRMAMDDWKNRWSLSHEITKAATKRSKSAEGRTPTQLLMDYIVDDFEAGEAWREYALTLKGSKQLTWSPGLRDLLKMGKEQGDGELAETLPDETTVYATFTLDQWQMIIQHDMRGEILSKAAFMEQEEFAHWIVGIFADWYISF